MDLPTPIPMELAELIAARLRVIGDPNRIRILDQLREGELSVAQITERLGTSQQNASKHLGVLLQAGVVARRRHGHELVLPRRRRGRLRPVRAGLRRPAGAARRADGDARGRALSATAPPGAVALPPGRAGQAVAGSGSGRTTTVSATGMISSAGRSASSACRRIASGLVAS